MVHLKGKAGFTLIEALIATAIMGIALAGIFALIGAAGVNTDRAEARQYLQQLAGQMTEVLEADIANIDQYGLDLTDCSAPGSSPTFAQTKRWQWCMQMASHVATAQVGETRQITVTDPGDNTRIVEILLESHGGQVQIVMKRLFEVGA